MTKEEYLAMSLLNDLKIQWKSEEIVNVDSKNIRYILDNISDVKPILRPLPTLVKEIEHKGEKFVPIDQLKEAIGIGNWCEAYDDALEVLVDNIESCRLVDLVERMPYQFIIQFTKWNFDIANLISKGEAIDVNTLKVNPYK